MRISIGLCTTAVLSALLATNAFAQEHDRAAILALMDQAFAAVGTGNPDDWRAIQLAEGTSLSFRSDPAGDPSKLEMRMSTNEALLAGEVEHGHRERWTGDPIVMMRGPIAVVWGEYDYWIDGQFSHCGVDSADVVKVDGEWKIANWMWTVETGDCPTDPSKPE